MLLAMGALLVGVTVRTICKTTGCPKKIYNQQELWCPLVCQLFTAVNSATKLTVVILNAYTGFANSPSASADVRNDLVYSNILV